ncbi:XK-related protein 6 isoform X1 [Drosophila subpulchrella]|uniref:XK-related protein 6 isoform X1 n=1 Tax=Drosophila subpulchrella TaxID=1486046 RepID=UPI0018A1AA9A|nr:XK-related protein 6 isoform X1 [Drosophila subpulchrella]
MASEESTQVDALMMEPISKLSMLLTGFSIFWRFVSIFINWSLAYEYWMEEDYGYCGWTVGSILVPMTVTSVIYIHTLKAGHSGEKRILERGVYSNVVISYLFRDVYALNYALKYTEAKRRDDQQEEIRYYQKLTTEECNVSFVRLFDSFLESAPQKILQLVIVLRSIKDFTYFRLIAFVVYFGNIAWCIQAYNHSNRLVQLDKHDIAAKGRSLQFLFLFCLTVSRTLCIAYVASLYPIETLIFCAAHACFCGTIVFFVDSPMIAESRFMNYLYCLCFGVVYLFIFTPVKDAPTKYKYVFYLSFCLLQNSLACALYIPLYLSIAIIALYVVGIMLIVFYYTNCHPNTIPTYF